LRSAATCCIPRRRSNILLLNAWAPACRVVAPATLCLGHRDMGAEVYHDMKEGLKGADV